MITETYIRVLDNGTAQTMVQVEPHKFVNTVSAAKLGLVRKRAPVTSPPLAVA